MKKINIEDLELVESPEEKIEDIDKNCAKCIFINNKNWCVIDSLYSESELERIDSEIGDCIGNGYYKHK